MQVDNFFIHRDICTIYLHIYLEMVGAKENININRNVNKVCFLFSSGRNNNRGFRFVDPEPGYGSKSGLMVRIPF